MTCKPIFNIIYDSGSTTTTATATNRMMLKIYFKTREIESKYVVVIVGLMF